MAYYKYDSQLSHANKKWNKPFIRGMCNFFGL